MNELLPLETTKKLIGLRNLLDRISQISWSFSVLNKQYPINTVHPDDVVGLLGAYEDLLLETKEVISKWQK